VESIPAGGAGEQRVGLSVYPPCTSLGQIRCFWRFSRLVESISYGGSIRLRIPIPPAGTIPAFDLKGITRALLADGSLSATNDATTTTIYLLSLVSQNFNKNSCASGTPTQRGNLRFCRFRFRNAQTTALPKDTPVSAASPSRFRRRIGTRSGACFGVPGRFPLSPIADICECRRPLTFHLSSVADFATMSANADI
jgi:hypothetical protein